VISTEYKLDKDLEQSKALQLILRKSLNGDLQSLEYNPKTGIAIARTRSFPAFNESEIKESDLSREISSLANDYKIAITKLKERETKQKRRESELNLLESKLSDDRKEFIKDRKKLDRRIAKFEKDLAEAGRRGLLEKVKSFFHRIN